MKSTLRRFKDHVYGIALPAPAPPFVPPPIVGIYDDGTLLHAWAYNADGSFRDELSTCSRPWTPGGAFVNCRVDLASLEEGLVLLVRSDAAGNQFAIWDLLANPPPAPTDPANVIPVVTLPGSYLGLGLNSFGYCVPFLHGGLVKWIADYGSGSGHHLSLWSSPLDAVTPPAPLSDLLAGASIQVYQRFLTDDEAAVLYSAFSNARLFTVPLDGSTPIDTAIGTDLSAAHARPATTLPRPTGGGTLPDSFWVGNDNSLTEKRQVLIRFDVAAGRLWKTFNSATAANFVGLGSARRAWSVSRNRSTSGIYPFDAAPPTGSVLKLLRPLGDPTMFGNSGADPRITLQGHEDVSHVAHTPQFAFLYDFPNLWS